MNRFDLGGRSAIITGAARGMGYAIADRFLESGASVSLWDVNDKLLENASTTLKGEGKIDCQVVDVSDYASVETAAKVTAGALGSIDILVNCAGIAGVNLPVSEYPIDIWNDVQCVNLNGVFHTCRAIVPYMQEKNYGRIVNIASIAGKEGNPNASAYSASKAAVIALTKSLGKELATTNITVNVVTPAVVKTEMLEDVTEEQIEYMLAKIPMGRMGTLDEVAALACWLSCEECSYTTGAVHDLSGGRATY